MQTIVVGVILSIYCAQASRYDPHAEYGAHERECFDELGLDAYEISKGFGAYMHAQEGNRDLNNFMACAWRKTGSLTERGEIDFGSMWSDLNYQAYKRFKQPPYVTSQYVNQIVNDCKYVDGYSPGDLVVKVHNCINNHFM